jgi:hypothetical protein
MAVTNPAPAGSSSLVSRVQAILMTPSAEWDKIEAEPATVQGLFTGYACILAAIPAIAQLIGSFIPICVLGVCVHRNPIFAVIGAVVAYVIGLIGVYITALIADELAPSFGGTKNRIAALKLIIYSWTAAWLAGIFAILPILAVLGILGLYSFFLLYRGAPKLMKVPQDKEFGYIAVTLIIAFVVFAIIGVISGMVVGMGAIGMGAATATTIG